jgi:phosphoglycerol transferase
LLLVRRAGAGGTSVLEGLVLFNAFALLLAGMGGLGSLASFVLGPWLRGYCRMSVFIAFFALFAIALFLDRFARRFAHTGRARILFAAGLALLIAAGLFDQALTPWDLEPLKPIYREEEAFVRSVEDSLPANAMVFQLPYMPFPEADHTYMEGLERFDHGVPTGHYDPLRCYLHSRTLRWSYGCMKGRGPDRWYRAVAGLPAGAMVPRLVLAGFDGVWVQRAHYADHGQSIESELTQALGTAPQVDGHQRFAFFSLEAYAERLRQQLSASEWAAEQDRLTPLISSL